MATCEHWQQVGYEQAPTRRDATGTTIEQIVPTAIAFTEARVSRAILP